jgi:hypothetical protein
MFKVPEKYRWNNPGGRYNSDKSFGNNGVFIVPHFKPGEQSFRVIASDGLGWEHVSVSLANRTPTWEEMNYIKEIFWTDEDWIMQFHPARSEYVNFHPHCLHLWCPCDRDCKTPQSWMVGPK